jgi:hypothetical protein
MSTAPKSSVVAKLAVASHRLIASWINDEAPPLSRDTKGFWIVDNGSADRGPKAAQRLLKKYRGPIHASWLNQIEIYFSIVQRKALTPNDFTSLMDLSRRLMAFEHHYQTIAQPFEWRFATGPRDPAKQTNPTSCKGSLKYVTEYMKRSTKPSSFWGDGSGECGCAGRE